MAKVIGIDLGTTNSCVAVLEGGEPVVIPNAEGGRTTPSVVAFTKDGERLVGQIAKRQAITNPDRTITSIKRKMGTKHRVKIDEKKYSPQEISAMIVGKLRNDAEDYLGEEIEKVVITCPAYFEDSQRQATKDAGKIAGLEVLRIINEPTAAALAYGLDKGEEQTILVFDLGGGTFDVSILEIGEGVFEVKATSGNNLLGGDDWDQKIMDYLLEEFYKEHDVSIEDDKAAIQRLKEAAEKAKIELSGRQSTNINLPYLAADEDGPKHLDVTLSRGEFENMTSELIKKLIGPTKRAIKDSKMKPSDIDKVILVGGSTRTPSVQKAVKDMLRKDPDKGVNPDECVAVGAAIQAGVLTGEVKDVLLLDVIPLSLGIETLGGVCSKFIPRNTTIPTSRTQIFSTAEDNQSSVEVHVLQGEREMAADNKTLGRFHLIGIPPAPRGVPQVEVCFDVDANGILSVSAKDLATGKEQRITVTASAGLAKGDIDSMIEESKKYAKKDRRKKKIAELRNKADSLIYSTEKAIEELGPKLDKGQRRKTEKAVAVLKESLKGDDPRKIKADVERLNDFSQELFTTMYSEAALRYDDEEEEMPPSRRRRDKEVMAPPPPPPDAGAIDVEYSEKTKKEKAAGKPPKKPAEEKATTIRCPKCKGKIKVTTDKRPLKIECPECGTKGTLKDDKKKAPKKEEEKPPKKVKKEEKPPRKEETEEKPPKKVKKEEKPPRKEETEEKPPKKVKKEEKPPKKEEKKKAATPLKIPCKCGGEIVVETDERPAKIECPKCGRKGTLK